MTLAAQTPTTLVTRSLVLRATRPEYAPRLWDAVATSLDELRPWMFWAEEASLDAHLEFTRDSRRAWEAGLAWGFTIFTGDRPVGHVGLAKHNAPLRSVEIGYWIATEVAGRGLMTEAAGAVVEFGFQDLGLHRIELRAAPDNVASVRVAEKLGFAREGLARSACRGAHGWHDVYVFGLLETDPRPGPFVTARSYNRLDESED